MLHLHQIIIYFERMALKKDILLTRKPKVVCCTVLETNIFYIKHCEYYLDIIQFNSTIPFLLSEQLQFEKRL